MPIKECGTWFRSTIHAVPVMIIKQKRRLIILAHVCGHRNHVKLFISVIIKIAATAARVSIEYITYKFSK
jgi:hypothetical protein